MQVRCSKPVAANGYGKAKINGIELPKGEIFTMDIIMPMHMLLIPVGAVATEYDTEYEVVLSGFVAEDGSVFRETKLKFRTQARGKQVDKYKEHDAIALEAAKEGRVLLKNKGNILPIPSDSVLNIFGAGFHMFRNSSTGASAINPRWQANFEQGIKEHSSFHLNEDVSAVYRGLKDVCPSSDQLKRARSQSDIAIFVISRTSGEFQDNRPVVGGYYLTDDEEKMIAEISKIFPKTIAILDTGYPIDMRWIEKYDIKSVIYAGFAGMLSGYALVEILDGRCNPSGKLPDTFCYDYYDYPASKNFMNLGKEDKSFGESGRGVHLYYEEDIYLGYRYFDTFHKPVAYCFGHGLSYTTFAIENVEIKTKDFQIIIYANVENRGECSGKEVVQVYCRAPLGKIEKPERILCGFEKTKSLSRGESQKIEMSIDPMNFASFDEDDGAYVLEKGEYTFYVGNSLENSLPVGSIVMHERKILRTVHRICKPVELFHRINAMDPEPVGLSENVDFCERIHIKADRKEYNPKIFERYNGKRISYAELKRNPNLLEEFVCQMSDKELCMMNVCGGSNWYMPWQKGEAGKTNVIRRLGMPRMTVSDGNTGLNIKQPNIGFPCSTVIAASFNKELVFKVGKTIGEESREHGIALNLGPGMNLHRNILNGRHPEYFSEDPYLAGIMAGYHAKGLESVGVASTYKHLFCNNSDTARKASQSIVSERALRELYFRAFEIAMSIQKPAAFMTSYNSLNGIYPAENVEILQTLIREEWKFDGYIMTDWDTYATVDPVEMVKAGNCWLTEGKRKYIKILYHAVKKGKLRRKILENNIVYLIGTMIRYV